MNEKEIFLKKKAIARKKMNSQLSRLKKKIKFMTKIKSS